MLKYLLYFLLIIFIILIIISLFKKDCKYSEWSICSDNKQIRSIISPSSFFGSCNYTLQKSCKAPPSPNTESPPKPTTTSPTPTSPTPTSPTPTSPTPTSPISSKPILYLKTIYSPLNSLNPNKYFGYIASLSKDGEYKPIMDFIGVPENSDNYIDDETGKNMGKVKFERIIGPYRSDSIFVIKDDNTQLKIGNIEFYHINLEERKQFVKAINTTWKKIDDYSYVYV